MTLRRYRRSSYYCPTRWLIEHKIALLARTLTEAGSREWHAGVRRGEEKEKSDKVCPGALIITDMFA